MGGPGELHDNDNSNDDSGDDALAARCGAMTPDQRRHTALLALWRLRAPLLALGTDPGWGIHRTAVERVFEAMLSAPGAVAWAEATAGLAPFLADPPEGEPAGTVAEVQLEVLAEVTAWRPSGDPGPEATERIVRLPRDLSRSLDQATGESLWDHPARRAHAWYLAAPPTGGTGYHTARNLSVETACHDLVATLPPGAPLPGTPAGEEALALCEAFSAELAATLAWHENLGR
ncbi:hypothetical protein [Streptomyces katrae]|uniref:Uncharacterized protein n=1 Tax=Streptomyces katrae TaxID=68223 RepID=A0A0F4JMN9_9ACTN|nr:hypothetical protein [Streptomyces katrae]KJY35632.1 hypothetical protein VR44_09655 [Streptomyces katrae]